MSEKKRADMLDRLSVEVVATRQIGAAQRTAIIELCGAAFAQDFAPLFDLVPLTSSHLLVLLDDLMIGHATWMTRWLEPQGQALLRTAYVDAVAIAPAYQGQGVGSLVMQQLAARIQDYDIAALSTSRVSFYRRLGWEVWQGPLYVRTSRGIQHTPEEIVMILRLPRTPADLDLTRPLSVDWRSGSVW
ncbi:MAG TPA: GNAT family N-acetyltransferase [Herpetosiphonaceae bacterium]